MSANDNDPSTMLVTLTTEGLKRLVREAMDEAVAGVAQGSGGREFLTPEGLAERLGVCSKSIKTMVSRDGLPAHELGPRLQRFLWSEVEQWLLKRGRNLGAPTTTTTPTNGRPRHMRSMK
jgi:excisionase family DNA binding protein